MTNVVHILLIEDDESNARLFQRLLRRPFGAVATTIFQVNFAYTLADGRTYLQTHTPDVVVLDLILPDGRGIELFQDVQAAVPHLPILLLTGFKDDALAAEALQNGAQDYLLKGNLKPADLARAILNALERNQFVQALRTQNAALHERLSDKQSTPD